MADGSETVVAPWTPEQVAALNTFQTEGLMHPFTCRNRPHPGDREAVLVAGPDGWTCPGCDYRQDWAHAWMADFEALERMRAFYRGVHL